MKNWFQALMLSATAISSTKLITISPSPGPINIHMDQKGISYSAIRWNASMELLNEYFNIQCHIIINMQGMPSFSAIADFHASIHSI